MKVRTSRQWPIACRAPMTVRSSIRALSVVLIAASTAVSALHPMAAIELE